ncbi:MAG: Hsp20/alpha crystallin family protein [Deltaproteobacteria bacterium]|nr:Hsp20/alpha crystallin family protein [Deltaproteobacteria bacterium]
MARIPKDIFERLSYFQQETEGLFRRLFADELGPGALGEEIPYPALDVVETEDDILVRADLPGLAKEEIVLYGAPNFLVIRGVKEAPAEKWSYLRLERSFGPFQRLVVLPAPGDSARVQASYQQGVLEVRIPKVLDRRKVHRQIPIE